MEQPPDNTTSPVLLEKPPHWEDLLWSVAEEMAAYMQTTNAPFMKGHSKRVLELTEIIAIRLGWKEDEIKAIRLGALLHDIGNIAIPSSILNHQGRLSVEQFDIVKEHALKGYMIIKATPSAWPIAEMVYQHHERLDGSGYPRGISGDEVAMGARILAVVDVICSMTADRPHRPATGLKEALEQIELNSGTLYDPDVVAACEDLFRDGDIGW